MPPCVPSLAFPRVCPLGPRRERVLICGSILWKPCLPTSSLHRSASTTNRPPQREYPVVPLGGCQAASGSRLLDPEGFPWSGRQAGGLLLHRQTVPAPPRLSGPLGTLTPVGALAFEGAWVVVAAASEQRIKLPLGGFASRSGAQKRRARLTSPHARVPKVPSSTQ